MIDAAKQFKTISEIVGGPDGVKAFFTHYKDTDGFRVGDAKSEGPDKAEKKDKDKKDEEKDDKKKKTGAELGKDLEKDQKLDLSIQVR